jgi:hypothetical protein
MSETFDDVQKRVVKNGGCDNWPCDYACLRRGECANEKTDYLLEKLK